MLNIELVPFKLFDCIAGYLWNFRDSLRWMGMIAPSFELAEKEQVNVCTHLVQIIVSAFAKVLLLGGNYNTI